MLECVVSRSLTDRRPEMIIPWPAQRLEPEAARKRRVNLDITHPAGGLRAGTAD